MSSAPTAIRAAANCYTQLLASQSDNNVKLIVLDRLNELKLNHREVRFCTCMCASSHRRGLNLPLASLRAGHAGHGHGRTARAGEPQSRHSTKDD